MTVARSVQPIDRSEWLQGGPLGILLIHGLGGTPVEMRFLARALARHGHTVFTMQLAGHCGTRQDLSRSTLAEWSLSVDRALDRLRSHCDIVIVGGLSMGAILALSLAHRRPNHVQGLLLLAPAFRLDGWSMPWTARLLNLVRPWMLPFDVALRERQPHGLKDERVRALVVGAMQSGEAGLAGAFSTPLAALAQFNALASAVRPRLGGVSQPTLIVHPRHDDMAHLRNAQHLQASLGGIVDSVILDDSYHLVTLDKQRAIVADRAADFVNRLARVSAPTSAATVQFMPRQERTKASARCVMH
jgi:carboxylesterase